MAGEARRPASWSIPSIAITLLLIVGLVARLIDSPSGAAPNGAPPPAKLEGNPEALAYLDRVEAICRAESARLLGTPKTTIHAVIRWRAQATSRMALLPRPPQVRDLRRRLLAERRRHSDTLTWAYRLMDRSSDPVAVYDRKAAPVIAKGALRMYERFRSFGIDCAEG